MPRKAQEINIFSIAKEAGVSSATVSRVANRNPGVKDAMRQRVETVLRKYAFKPNSSAARKSNIAILLPNLLLGSYTTAAISGVYRYALRKGFAASLVVRERNFAEEIRERQCSGAIALLSEIFPCDMEQLRSLGIPLLLFDSVTDAEDVGFVTHDSYAGACEAVRHLLDLGHRKIAFFHEGPSRKDHMQRLKGYEDAMKSAGLGCHASLIFQAPNLESCHAGVKMAERLLQQAPDVTAIFAVDDNIAMGAMTAIHRKGLRVPEDISVVGFDNYDGTQHWFPSLTTVNHPIVEAAEMAATAIDNAFRDGHWTPPRSVLPTKLIKRDSTGPAPDGHGSKQREV